MEYRTHRGIKYRHLTKKSNPKEGEVLYTLPQPEDGDIPVLEQKVTSWGADNHGEEDSFLIEVTTIYPQEILDIWIKKHGKKILKTLPYKKFVPLECLYEKIEL